MSTVTSCNLLGLGARLAAAPTSSSGAGRLLPWKAAAVALPCFQRKSSSLCFANNPKGDHYGPKADLPPFNISPFALVHPVSLPEERWQMKEEAGAVSMWFQVPGLSKEDLVVELDEDVLVIRKKLAKAELDNHDVLEQQRAPAGANTYRETTRTTVTTTGAGAGAESYKVSSSAASRANKAGAAGPHDGEVYARLLVPAGYSREYIEAELASGVLKVTIAKVKEHARRRINVDIHVIK